MLFMVSCVVHGLLSCLWFLVLEGSCWSNVVHGGPRSYVGLC